MIRRAISPLTIVSAPRVLVFGALSASVITLFFSLNTWLWLISLAALVFAILIAGGSRAYPALLCVIGFFWLAIVGDLGAADAQGFSIEGGLLGADHDTAIIYSLCAMIMLAIGMRSGVVLGKIGAGYIAAGDNRAPMLAESLSNLRRLLFCYFVSLIFNNIVSIVAWWVPSLTQPLLAFALIHFVFLYLVAYAVFETGRGFVWLLIVMGAAMGAGMIGFWSGFKEPVFVVLIALGSVPSRLDARHWAFGVVTFATVIWLSLVWTAVKDEYRADVVTLPIDQRMIWLVDQYVTDSIDIRDAEIKLLKRVGYTDLFSIIISEDKLGFLTEGSKFYTNAIVHVLTPRIIFPNKPDLDDSSITERLVHWNIAAGTSIGVGFVAQAYVDFGFPGFLIPISIIGLMSGYAARYFMTRRLPVGLCQALAVAVLFLNFRFETDIDKGLGGFITAVIAMGLAAKFALPPIVRWLGQASSQIGSRRPSIKRPPLTEDILVRPTVGLPPVGVD